MRDDIERYWQDLEEMARAIPFHLLEQAADLLLACYRRDGTVFIMGNGGSAATSSHFACDLTKGTRTEYAPPFRVMPLTDNVPLMTAWANDTAYDRIFAEQLRALVRPGDVVVLISASGNSPNMLAAARVAGTAGATTVSFTGRGGGKLRALSDLAVCVPSDQIELVEDAHIAIGHSLCVALRRRLAGYGAVIAAEAVVEEQLVDRAI
jgi:D-sedoheptulose 7-phosphate isomerase